MRAEQRSRQRQDLYQSFFCTIANKMMSSFCSSSLYVLALALHSADFN